MTLDEFRSRLKGLEDVDETYDRAVGEYLKILKPVPEPRLAAGRERVLAEAARVRPSGEHRTHHFLGMVPRMSLTWTLALFLLVGGITTATLASNSTGGVGLFFGRSFTPTVAFTNVPLTQVSATVSLAPTPLNAPARLPHEIVSTPAPAPTPAPTLPLIEPAQSQPTTVN